MPAPKRPPTPRSPGSTKRSQKPGSQPVGPSAITAATRVRRKGPLPDAFEQALREHYEGIIQRAVRGEQHRREREEALTRLAEAEAAKAPRGKKTPAAHVRALVRHLAAGDIVKAAGLLAVTPGTLRRWMTQGAPAAQQWRIADAREQIAARLFLLKRNSAAIIPHLQQAMLHGMLPERVDDAIYRVESQRRSGHRQVKTWRWPVIGPGAAQRITSWFSKALAGARRKRWQAIIGYAQFGELPSEQRDGYRAGKQVAWQPNYSGPKLEFEKDITVEGYWNSTARESRRAMLAELRVWLLEVVGALQSGTVQRLDVTELRNFEWRKAS